MARVERVFWRDIPVRVMVRQGRTRAQRSLSQRFQDAMERAALREGKGQSHALLEDWRRESQEREGAPEDLLAAEIQALEDEFDEARLRGLVRACGRAGVDPSSPPLT